MKEDFVEKFLYISQYKFEENEYFALLISDANGKSKRGKYKYGDEHLQGYIHALKDIYNPKFIHYKNGIPINVAKKFPEEVHACYNLNDPVIEELEEKNNILFEPFDWNPNLIFLDFYIKNIEPEIKNIISTNFTNGEVNGTRSLVDEIKLGTENGMAVYDKIFRKHETDFREYIKKIKIKKGYRFVAESYDGII